MRTEPLRVGVVHASGRTTDGDLVTAARDDVLVGRWVCVGRRRGRRVLIARAACIMGGKLARGGADVKGEVRKSLAECSGLM